MQYFKDAAGAVYAYEDDVDVAQKMGPAGPLPNIPDGLTAYTPPPPTDADLLSQAQAQKAGEIYLAFASAAISDVTDANGIVWNGGESSGNKIFLACQMAQQNGATTVDLWDKANTRHSLSIADGMAVAAAIGAAYQSAFAHYQDLKAQIAAATTVADVDAISW